VVAAAQLKAEEERSRMMQEAWQQEKGQLESASERGGRALLEMKETSAREIEEKLAQVRGDIREI